MLKIDPKQEKSSLKIDNFISIISIFIDNNIQKKNPDSGVKKDRKWIRSERFGERRNERISEWNNGAVLMHLRRVKESGILQKMNQECVALMDNFRLG